MSKIVIDDLIKEIKNKSIVIGPKVAFKKLKKNMIEKIYFSKDCSKEVINKFKKLKSKVEMINLEINKEDLKEICKKSFNISVISILGKKKPTKKKEEESKKEEKKEKKEKKKTIKKEIKKKQTKKRKKKGNKEKEEK